MIGRVLFFLALLGVALAGDVVVLQEKNFDKVVAENELVFVEFYAPWCGHCKQLTPVWNALATEMKEKGIVVAKVDCIKEKSIGERFKVEGFPTIKLFRSGEPVDYDGGRSKDDLAKYLMRQTGPSVTPLDSADAVKEFVADSIKAVAFAAEGSELSTFFTGFAKKNRDDFDFGLVSSASVATAQGETMETIVFYKNFEEAKVVYTGLLEDEDLSSFLRTNSIKLLDEIGPDNYKMYLARGVPIAWMFLDLEQEEMSEAAKQTILAVAEPHRTSLSFVYLDGAQYKQMATKMGLTGDKFPCLAIETADGAHFLYSEEEDFAAEGMRTFLMAYSKGELKPNVKSEPIPEEAVDTDGVTVVVGENFKDVVLAEGKDVLISFYAPWCGHCKQLKPAYSKLAKSLASVPSLVVAKSDGTLNDYPADFKVEGFPTIMLVTASNKIIPFEGDRSEKGMVDFLAASAEVKFETPAAAAGDADEDSGRDEL